jgi:hypothetical protein
MVAPLIEFGHTQTQDRPYAGRAFKTIQELIMRERMKLDARGNLPETRNECKKSLSAAGAKKRRN